MKKTIIWLIIIGVVAALGVYLYVFHFAAKHQDPLKAKNKVEISAEQLFADYTKNEKLADSLYSGKPLSVTGRVRSIELNGNRYTIMFETNDSNGTVLCEMDTMENARLKTIQPGSEVHLVGFGNGFLGDVQLDRGKLAK